MKRQPESRTPASWETDELGDSWDIDITAWKEPTPLKKELRTPTVNCLGNNQKLFFTLCKSTTTLNQTFEHGNPHPPGIIVSGDLSVLAPRVQGFLSNINMDLATMNSILLEQKLSGVWSSRLQVLTVIHKRIKVNHG